MDKYSLDYSKVIGQAICCGEPAKLGHHKYHVYNGVVQNAWGFYCEKCYKNAPVWSFGHLNDVPFALECWNRLFQPYKIGQKEVVEPKLNAPDGFRWGSLNFHHSYIGGCDDRRIAKAALFKTEHEDIVGAKAEFQCYIDENRYLRNLIITNICTGKSIDLQWFINARNCYSYVHTSTCTDGSSWYALNINMVNSAAKHLFHLVEDMASIGFDLTRK